MNVLRSTCEWPSANMCNAFEFISYWYMRWLLVSELYLVEKWERHMMHVIVFTLFFGFWFINKILIDCMTYYSLT